jgi:hypothetical protein
MSILTDSLELILPAIEQDFPRLVDSFLPGLPKQQIQSMIASLDLPCPEELIELYHWRNGCDIGTDRDGFPPGFVFLPLEEVVENYVKWYKEPDELQVLDTIRWHYGYQPPQLENILAPLGVTENHKMLPFIDAGECYFYSIVVSGERTYITLDHMEDGDPKPYFDSLTALVQTLLEVYQERVYSPYLEDDYESFKIHPEPFKRILEKYNPLTSKFTLPDIDVWLVDD